MEKLEHEIPSLETERLRFRPFTEDDAAAVFAIGSDAEVTRTVFWPRQESLDDSLKYIRFMHADDISSAAICRRAEGDLIGTIFFHSFQPYHRRVELAFNVARAHWGQGYATEAAEAITNHVLAHWPIHRVEATCMTDNPASARVLEKAGFEYEGTSRQSHRRNDRYHDMKRYAKLL